MGVSGEAVSIFVGVVLLFDDDELMEVESIWLSYMSIVFPQCKAWSGSGDLSAGAERGSVSVCGGFGVEHPHYCEKCGDNGCVQNKKSGCRE